MVNWQSPEVLELTYVLYNQMVVFVLGVFLWYFVLSWGEVELGLVTRKLRFRLAHVPYLFGRYTHLTTLITIVVTTHMAHPPVLSCSGINGMRVFMQLTGQIAMVASSGNLALRVVALWHDRKRVTHAVGFVIFVHFVYAVVCSVVGVHGRWDAVHIRCVIVADAARNALYGFFIFTLAWDVVIFIMTAAGMWRARVRADTPLGGALVAQGVGYALATLLTLIPMTVMSFMNLNDTMGVFFVIPGGTISIITSSKAVIALLHVHDAKAEPQRARAKPVLGDKRTPAEMLTSVVQFSYGQGSSSSGATSEGRSCGEV